MYTHQLLSDFMQYFANRQSWFKWIMTKFLNTDIVQLVGNQSISWNYKMSQQLPQQNIITPPSSSVAGDNEYWKALKSRL